MKDSAREEDCPVRPATTGAGDSYGQAREVANPVGEALGGEAERVEAL
jgi:hypothetical protein